MKTLSECLFNLRKSKKFSQMELAKKTNLSLRTYQRYEKGERNPTSDVLISLADYFNVSIDYLVGRTDNPEINK